MEEAALGRVACSEGVVVVCAIATALGGIGSVFFSLVEEAALGGVTCSARMVVCPIAPALGGIGGVFFSLVEKTHVVRLSTREFCVAVDLFGNLRFACR